MNNLEQLECYDISGLLYTMQANLSKLKNCYNLCIMDALIKDSAGNRGSAERCAEYQGNCDRCIACYLEEPSKEDF